MNKKIYALFLLFFVETLFCQEIKTYTWDAKPEFDKIPEKYIDQPAVVLLDKRWIHTRVGSYAFATFVMNHVAVKINKAEEINNFNKVKAEDNGSIRELRDFHARVIKPDGQIIVLPEDRIVQREVDKVKSIVFEGVEAGDILEYYFIIKESPSTYAVEVFQREVPVINAQFIWSASGVNFTIDASPAFLKMSEGGKNYYYTKNIAPYKSEPYACNQKEIVKLFYSVSNTGSYYSQWETLLPSQYKRPSFNLFSKTQAREFIDNLNLDGLTLDQKMQKIDSYIKQNFDFVGRGEKANKVTDLSNGKQKLRGSEIFDLYGFIMKEQNIPYHVVIGVDRFYGDINNERVVYGMPHESMYYIPETKKFISPFEKYLFYGYPMYELQSSKGVAYSPQTNKIVDYGFTFPVIEAQATTIGTTSNVSFTPDATEIIIKKEATSTGYRAAIERQQIKYFKELADENETQRFYKSVLMGNEDIKYKNLKIENENFDANYTNTPLKVTADLTFNTNIVEDAGNLLIVNIGKVIGTQTNLYQEEARTKDVDLTMTKKYVHKIIFTIPDNYTLASYEGLVFDKKMQNNKDDAYFISTVKQNGNQLYIEVEESYNKIHFGKELYPEYRNVINASSDFFKGSIILKKK